jgi:formamidopyrimidine-DNA glycosylase
MKNCKGITGWLFGHKFEAVYDTDTEQRSAEEMERIAANAQNLNFWSFSHRGDPKMNPDVYKNKRITKVYKGHFCPRCGLRIDDANFKL